MVIVTGEKTMPLKILESSCMMPMNKTLGFIKIAHYSCYLFVGCSVLIPYGKAMALRIMSGLEFQKKGLLTLSLNRRVDKVTHNEC